MKINRIQKNYIFKTNQTEQNKKEYVNKNTNETKLLSFNGYSQDYEIRNKREKEMMQDNNLKKYEILRNKIGEELEDIQHNTELTCWNFYTNSTNENLQKYTNAQEEMSNFFKNEDYYNQLREIKQIGVNDKHLNKEIKDLTKVFYNEIESGDELKALRDKENEIATKYNSFKMEIDGKPVTKAEIQKILETKTDTILREKAYKANISAGDCIAEDLIELVKMRNAYAKTKGYDNYFDYMIDDTYNISPEKLDELLTNVYSTVKDKCIAFDKERKDELAKEYNIDTSELKDYHYGLITQNSPDKIVNEYLKSKEQVVDIAIQAYKNMGYDVKNMPITLDLYPRENKNTHGFAFCIKPGEDARILANLTNNVHSLDTILHELGHCIYDIGISTNLPLIEQECSSPVMTEAVAMMMGDLVRAENILAGIVPQDELDKFKKELVKDDAKFVTRSLEIINFEKEMYKNPEQDFKALWKAMKQKYLFRGDNTEKNNEWATIPHYLSHPGYYQNYFRAALMKAQLYNAMVKRNGELTRSIETSKILDKELFSYGSSIDEEELTKQFTGKALSAEDFCARF